MIIQDDGGKIGNEIIVAVLAGAFVFAVLAGAQHIGLAYSIDIPICGNKNW